MGDTEGKLEKYRWAGGRDERRWTGQGDGGVQRVTTIKRGAERHPGDRERERERWVGVGDEINLLIFHGQTVVITMFSALRAFGVGQFECVHMRV